MIENKLILAEMLKYHEDEVFYSPAFGEVRLIEITQNPYFPITVEEITSTNKYNLTKYGEICYDLPNAECILFPSKENRSWKKWKKEQKTNKYDWNYYMSHIDTDTIVFKEDIAKSGEALKKILTLIDKYYGGLLDIEERRSFEEHFYTLDFDVTGNIEIVETYGNPAPCSFHTKQDANNFLSCPANVELLKEYYL